MFGNRKKPKNIRSPCNKSKQQNYNKLYNARQLNLDNIGLFLGIFSYLFLSLKFIENLCVFKEVKKSEKNKKKKNKLKMSRKTFEIVFNK